MDIFKSRMFWIFFIVVFLVGYGAAVKPIYDFDVDWHLAAGRWMVENRETISTDPFSYTFYGKQWTSITWLHEIITWLIYSIGGDSGLVLVISVIPGLTMLGLYVAVIFLIYFTERQSLSGSTVYFSLFTAIMSASIIAQYRWAARPEIWSYFLGCVMIMLLSINIIKSGKYIYYGILVQLLWVNTHGIFIMGSALFSLVAVIETIIFLTIKNQTVDGYQQQLLRLKRLYIATAGVFLICLINPRGINGLLWPLHLFNVLKSKTFSLMIPEAIPLFGEGKWSHDSYILLVLLIFYSFCLLSYGIKLILQNRDTILGTEFRFWLFGLIIFLVTMYTSFSARRNIPLVLLWCFPFVFYSLFRLLKPRFVLIVCSVICVLLLWSDGQSIVRSKRSLQKGFRDLDRMPERTAQFLEDREIFGNTFTTVSDANYFLRRIYGKFKPYIDSRFAELYNEQHFTRYMNILASPRLIDQEVDRLHIDNIIVGHHLPLATSLLQYLNRRKDRWLLVHIDEMAAVFVDKNVDRYKKWAHNEANELPSKIREEVGSDNIRHFSIERLTGLGRALALIDLYQEAYELFKEAYNRNKNDYEVVAGYCNISWLLCTRLETFPACAINVKPICEEAIELSPHSLQAIVTAGIVNRAMDNLAEAENCFRKATEIDTKSYEAFMQLAETLQALGRKNNNNTDLFEAVETYWEAARLRPYDPEPHFYRAEILRSLELMSDAEESYRLALARTREGELRNIIIQRLTEIGATLP